jgi:hypothetical protein
MFIGLFASPSPVLGYDLAVPNEYDFTQELIDSTLDAYRSTYETWLDTPGFFSKGQTGLMILDLFALRDSLADAAEFQGMIISDQLDEIFGLLWYVQNSFYFITDGVEDQYDLIDNLYAFMTEGKADSIMMFRDSLEQHLQDTYEMTMDNIGNTLWNVGMFGDSLGARFDTVLSANEDFMFRVGEVSIEYDAFSVPYLDTTEVAMIYDETYESIWTAVNYLIQGVDYLGRGIENILDGDSTMAVGLDTLAMSMVSFQQVADTLNNYSMWSFMDSTDLANIGNAFHEAEAIVNGKTYFIPVKEDTIVVDSVEIRPISIVENIHYGLYQTYIDMYWQTDPYTYTFRNIFPQGIPADIIDVLGADLVIDPRDSLEQLEQYFAFKIAEFNAKLIADPTNVDLHVGLGYLQSVAMIRDAVGQFQTIAALVDGGRIDSLFQNYDWANLDYTDEIADIRNNLNWHYDAMINDNYQLFTILIKDPYQSVSSHDVQEGDLVYPIYIIPQVTDGIVTFTYMVENTLYAIADGLEYVYGQIDSVIDISLDPNLLDLSNIEEPLDLIYALEASNPNFGTFTPEGKIKFAAFGDSLAIGMQGLADFADTVIATVDYAGPLLGEFGMSPEDHDTLLMGLAKVNYHLDMFAADMATPEVYTYMDNDTLNLSAWFDNVPDNMLAVFKDYFEGRDASLAGFFPTKMVTPGVDPNHIPAEFALKDNYPNPFNPTTTIAFDLPSDGMVSMDVFNLTGRRVASLIKRDMRAGTYELTWNAMEQASGVYIVRLQYGSQVAFQKMTLLK